MFPKYDTNHKSSDPELCEACLGCSSRGGSGHRWKDEWSQLTTTETTMSGETSGKTVVGLLNPLQVFHSVTVNICVISLFLLGNDSDAFKYSI